MKYEQPNNVCSVRHIFCFENEKKATPVLNDLIRQSFEICSKGNYKVPPGTQLGCNCSGCKRIKTIFYKQYPTEADYKKDQRLVIRKIQSWNYRLLLAFQDESGIYFKKFLTKNLFRPKFEYIGDQGGNVTVWGLHIPTYLEDNKIPLDSKSFLLEDQVKRIVKA